MSCPVEQNKQFELKQLLNHVQKYNKSYSDWINYYSSVTVASAGLDISTSPSLSGGGIQGLGTQNYLSKWNNTGGLTNSQIYDNGTNIGIGTSTPNEKLTVIGNISATNIIYGSNSNSANWSSVYTTVQNNSGSWGTSNNTIDTGVRSLTSNWQSTYTTFSNNSTNYILQGGNTFTTELSIGTNNTQNLILETNSSPRIHISGSSGNIGFGTIPSTYRLDLFDSGDAPRGIRVYNSNTGSSARALLQLGNNTNGAAAALMLNSSANTNFGTDSLILIQGLPAPLVFATSGAERIRILSDGKVGINTTAPNQILTVAGNISATNIIYDSNSNSNNWSDAFTNVRSNSANYVLQGGNTLNVDLSVGTTNTKSLIFETNNTTRMIIASSGSIGIGSNNPSDLFQVAAISANADFSGRVDSSIASHRPSFRFIRTGGTFLTPAPPDARLGLLSFAGIDSLSALTTYSFIDSYLSGAPTDGAEKAYLRFFTTNNGSAGERLRIDSTGYIGIGTSTPAYLLQLSIDSAAKPSTNTWTIASDERLKDNIILADTDRCYEIVKELPLKRYTWKEEIYSQEQVSDRSKIGWIAQDVQTMFPKGVDVKTQTFIPNGSASKVIIDNCLSLNADQIYAAMYGAVQKLITIVETQSATISALETRLQALEIS